RDHGCRFPGCCETRFVDAHHIHHWCDGGETRLDNLVLLCRRHHRLLHQEGYEVVRDAANNVEFVRPDGTEIARALFPQFEDVEDDLCAVSSLEMEHRELGLDIDAGTAITAWLVER